MRVGFIGRITQFLLLVCLFGPISLPLVHPERHGLTSLFGPILFTQPTNPAGLNQMSLLGPNLGPLTIWALTILVRCLIDKGLNIKKIRSQERNCLNANGRIILEFTVIRRVFVDISDFNHSNGIGSVLDISSINIHPFTVPWVKFMSFYHLILSIFLSL